jgi:AcrR family transcriptional regulator
VVSISETPGPQSAREQLVQAAIEVLQTKVPAQIRSREIASRAQVNYGLIHHYFGSKDALLRAALERLISDYVADLPPADSLFEVASPLPVSTASTHARLWNVLANIAGDPEALDVLTWDYPVLRHAVAQAEARHGVDDTLAIRASIAAAATLTLGWMTYRHFVRRALELSETEMDEVTSRIAALIDELWSVDPGAPSPEDG